MHLRCCMSGKLYSGNYLQKRLRGKSIWDAVMVSGEIKRELGNTFVTATDGNHGRGCLDNKTASAGNRWYTCRGAARRTPDEYQGRGTRCIHHRPQPYDEAVRFANNEPEQRAGWWFRILLGGKDMRRIFPVWDHMQGYGTMGYGSHMQLPEKPTHVSSRLESVP